MRGLVKFIGLLLLSVLVFFTPLFAIDEEKSQELEIAIENPKGVSDIFVLLDALSLVNQQIGDYKNTHKGASEDDAELQTIVAKKAQLLQHLPELILGNKKNLTFDKKANTNQIHQLELQVQANKSQQRELLALRDTITIQSLQTDSDMYDFFSNLNTTIKSYPSTQSIEDLINTELFNLKNINLSDYNRTLQSTQTPNNTSDDLLNQLQDLQIKVQTDIEALEYLRLRVDDFAANFFLTNLNIQNIIDAINENIPYYHSINWGKIILCVFIIIFMASFGKLFAKMSYLIISKIAHQHDNEELKQKTIYALTRPITLLLIVIALEFSIDICYYPLPAPPFVNKWFGVCYIVLVAWFLIALLEGYGTGLITTIAQKHSEGFRKEVLNLALKVVYFAIVVVSILLILKQLGFDVSTLVASLGIGGLAVALAVKDMLANFFASVMLLFDNSFSQGDWIVCGDVEGTVVEIGLRRTTVRTFDNALLFVPNSKLANEYIKNWSRRQAGRRIRMVIGLNYNSPRDRLQQCIKDIRTLLENHPKISTENNKHYANEDYTLSFKKDIVSVDDYSGYKTTLLVFLDELGESSINILVYCFSKTTIWKEWLTVKEEIIFEIMQIIEKNHLTMAFPSQSIYVESFPKESLPISK